MSEDVSKTLTENITINTGINTTKDKTSSDMMSKPLFEDPFNITGQMTTAQLKKPREEEHEKTNHELFMDRFKDLYKYVGDDTQTTVIKYLDDSYVTMEAFYFLVGDTRRAIEKAGKGLDKKRVDSVSEYVEKADKEIKDLWNRLDYEELETVRNNMGDNPEINAIYVSLLGEKYGEVARQMKEYSEKFKLIIKDIDNGRLKDVEVYKDENKETYEQQEELDELLELQEKLSKEIKEDKDVDKGIHIKYLTTEIVDYIPKNEIKELTRFLGEERAKTAEINKAKALQESSSRRMQTAVRLFLEKGDGVTDKGMSALLGLIIKGTDFAEMSEGANDLKAKKLELVERLGSAENAGDIMRAFAEAKSFAVAKVDEMRELSLESPFFTEHPHAAKIVMMHRLLQTMEKSKLTADVELMYNALIGSDEYQNEVKKQRLGKVQTAIKKQKAKDSSAPGLDKGAAEYMRTLLNKTYLFKAVTADIREDLYRRILAAVPYITSRERYELLSRDEISEVVDTVFSRFKTTKDLNDVMYGDAGYKDYALDLIIRGMPYLSLEDYKLAKTKRVEEARKMKKHLATNTLYTDKKQIRIRLLQGRDLSHSISKSSKKSGDPAAAAARRIERIGGLNVLVKDVFAKAQLDVPKSFYEFRNQPGNDHFSASKMKSKYNDYIDGYFKNVKTIKGGKDKIGESKVLLGKEYSTWSSIGKLIKENYSEYGVSERTYDLVGAMGDDLYLKSHKDYLDKLAQVNETLTAPEEIPQETEESKKFNERFTKFMKSEDKDFSFLAKVLGEDERFLEHLAADNEAEYEMFLLKVVPACDAIKAEFKKHLYDDQYLIEREKEIRDIVLSGETENVANILALHELDDEIEKTKINGKTFMELFREQMIIKKDEKSVDDLFGSLYVEMAVEKGASIVFEGLNVKDRKKKMEAKYNALKTAFKEEYSKLAVQDKPDEEVLFKIYLQNEKKKLFTTSEGYAEDVKARIKGDLEKLAADYNERKALTAKHNEYKAKGEEIVAKKEDGRRLINNAIAEGYSQFSFVTPAFIAKIETDEDIAMLLRGLVTEAKDYCTNPFLESVYFAYMKKMVLHANDNDFDSVLRDARILMRFKCFNEACDYVIGTRKDVKPEYRFSLKKGLFEYYAEDLMNNGFPGLDSKEENIEQYKKILEEELPAAVKEGEVDGLIKFYTDDKGGYTGISGTKTYDERAFKAGIIFKLQEYVLDLDMNQTIGKVRGYTSNELCVLGYIMQNYSSVAMLESALTHITLKDASETINLEESAIMMAYIRGETLDADMLGVDYKNLAKGITRNFDSDKLIMYAIGLLDEINQVKAYEKKQSFYDKKEETVEVAEELVDVEAVRKEMSTAWDTTTHYMKDLSKDKQLTNEDKLWRFYTVARCYSDVFERYQKALNLGKLVEWDKRELGVLFDLYARLQEYFSSEVHDPETSKKIYGTAFVKYLGILSEDEFYDVRHREEHIEKELGLEKTRQEITDIIRKHTYEKTGRKPDREKRLKDVDEADFPPEVVAEVKKIDRWIAEHSLKRLGDSERGFSVEILSRPIRERLFVYYLIENEKDKVPTELDCALALTGYVPDCDKFVDSLDNTFFLDPVSFMKRSDIVNHFGFLDNIGRYATSRIENGIRMLEDPNLGFEDYLKQVLNDHKLYENPAIPKEVKLRQMCYCALMEEVSRYRLAIKGKSEKEIAESEEIARENLRLRRALRRLIKANEALKKIDWKDDISKTFTDDSLKAPWKFDGEKLEEFVPKKGIVNTAGMLFYLASSYTSVKSIFAPGQSKTGRFRDVGDAVVQGGGTITRINTYSSFVPDKYDRVIPNGAKIVGNVLIATGATTKAIISAGQYYMVNKAEKEATNLASELDKQQEEKAKKGEVEVKKPGAPTVVETVKNVNAMQKSILKSEIATNVIRTTGAVASTVAAILDLPFAGIPVGSFLADLISELSFVVRTILGMVAKSGFRQKVIDNFLNIDELYAKVRPKIDKLEMKDWKKYGYFDDRMGTIIEGEFQEAIKDRLRKDVLKELHYTTADQLFIDIASKYAFVSYRHIFFDEDGNRIFADNTEAIEKREPLRKLFAGLKFTYPTQEGEVPSPTVEQIHFNLIRDIK